ncbi:hypothetical protein RQP54_17885 [Curvibacter sp. APW13]|uniref:hypothetical protein n=1 Tax=Curvibacter sp. APW13 TaxID=3077236 RepID=UPI0028E03316|nr:hypothetical protein [Curvibacter sp. APW13]MDT8992748.1 hypothetical protein [Curvibacter sp. APW13]
MGYTHNWKHTMPPGEVSQFMFRLESQYIAHLLPHFQHTLGDDGCAILHHKLGQAEGFALGPCRYDFGESCKTDRGLAEIHIAEVLWRTAFAINDAGGTMVICSDSIWRPVREGQLDEDSAVLLTVLLHRCADLLDGRKVEIKAVPQHWPQIEDSRGIAIAQQRMLSCEPGSERFDQVLFGLDELNEADYQVILQPGSPSFRGAVYRHTQAFRFNQPPILRGLYSHALQVHVDGKLFAGDPGPLDAHAEVSKRTIDLAPMIPSADWLDQIARERELEAQET